MNKLIALAALAALTAGCASAEQGFIARRSKGQTAEQGAMDMANCRNQARLVAGANRYAWYSDVYRDCMVGKGYELNVGQTE
jgi:Flp pilus assembly protein TadD